jgi:hypothetical protein
MDKYIKTDVEGMVKDLTSGAILNVDNGGLDAYRRQKAVLESAKSTNGRINKLENDIGEIKQMLQLLLKR